MSWGVAERLSFFSWESCTSAILVGSVAPVSDAHHLDVRDPVLVVESSFGHLLLKLLLNLIHRLLQGDVHDAQVHLDLETDLQELVALPSNSFGAWKWNRSLGLKGLTLETAILYEIVFKHK